MVGLFVMLETNELEGLPTGPVVMLFDSQEDCEHYLEPIFEAAGLRTREEYEDWRNSLEFCEFCHIYDIKDYRRREGIGSSK